MNQTVGKGRGMVSWLSGALIGAMLLGATPVAAAGVSHAERYVALGDSISSGYGLEYETEKFTRQVANENHLSLTSLAQNGETSGTLLERLGDPEVASAVAQADVITITVGGNDLLNALYGYLAEEYDENHTDTPTTEEEMKSALMGGDASTLAFALGAVRGFSNSEQEQTALSQFASNLTQVVGQIQAENPGVWVVLANQYNPYSYLVKELSKFPLIGAGARSISQAFEVGVRGLNAAIASVGEQMGCTVVDVYAAFEDAQENPCNADLSAAMELNLDFHPNAYGHSLIAQVVTAAANTQMETGARTVSGQTTQLTQRAHGEFPPVWAMLAGGAGVTALAAVAWLGTRRRGK